MNNLEQQASEQQKKLRETLLARLLDALKHVQSHFGRKKELATDTDDRVRSLTTQIESILCHGMKRSLTAPALDTIRQMTQTLTRLKLDSLSQDDINLWSMLRCILNEQEIVRFLKLTHVTTDGGRSRAWIRSALNERSLQRNLQAILDNQQLLEEFYEDQAFLRDTEMAATLPQIVQGLGTVVFALKIDCAELNSSRRLQSVETSDLLCVQANRAPAPLMAISRGNHSKFAGLDKPSKKRSKKTLVNIVSFDDNDNAKYSTSEDGTMKVVPKKPHKRSSLGDVGTATAGETSSLEPPQVDRSQSTGGALTSLVLDTWAKTPSISRSESVDNDTGSETSTGSFYPAYKSLSNSNMSRRQRDKSIAEEATSAEYFSGSPLARVMSYEKQTSVISNSTSVESRLTPDVFSDDLESLENGGGGGQDDKDEKDKYLHFYHGVNTLSKIINDDTPTATATESTTNATAESPPDLNIVAPPSSTTSIKSLIVGSHHSAIAREKSNESCASSKLSEEAKNEPTDSLLECLRGEIVVLKRRNQDLEANYASKLRSAQSENEMLRNQLRGYMEAVRTLNQEKGSRIRGAPKNPFDDENDGPQNGSEETSTGIAGDENGDEDDDNDPVKDYENKLIQVAQMHAELSEFNDRLIRDLNKRKRRMTKFRNELIALRGPLLEDYSDDEEGGQGGGRRCQIELWLPTAFQTGKAADVHHIYQVYIRVGNAEWNVYRRYKDFLDLHKTFKKEDPVFATFNFPPKKAVGRKEKKFVEERRKGLESYLRNGVNYAVNNLPEFSAIPINKDTVSKHIPFFKE